MLRIRELLLTDNDFPNECFARVSLHASFTVNRELRTFKTKWIYSIIFQFPSIGLSISFPRLASFFLQRNEFGHSDRFMQIKMKFNFNFTFNNTLLIFLNFENN